MSAPVWVELGGSKDDMVEILNYCTETEKYIPLFSTISSFEAPSSTLGEDRHMPPRTFLSEIQCPKTFIWSFFRNNAYFWQRSAQKWMQFSVSVSFNILTISSFETPSSTQGGRLTYGLGDFFERNSVPEKLLFKAFFGILRIFGNVRHKSECIFLFLYNLIFQLNTGDNHMLSPVAIKNGVCPHSSCSSALVWPASHHSQLRKCGEGFKCLRNQFFAYVSTSFDFFEKRA